MEQKINYKGKILKVRYYEEKGSLQTLENEKSPNFIQIEQVYINGIDITELLESQITEITDCLIKYIK